MDGGDLNAALLRLFFGQFDDAHRDGKLMHNYSLASFMSAIESERGERGLPETDAAIVRWNDLFAPDLDRLFLEERLEIFQQQFVLKNASGQDDNMKMLRSADGDHRVAQALSQSTLEGARNFSRVPPAKPGVDYRLQQQTKIQFLPVEWKQICFGERRAARELLQPHRGLALERYFAGKAQQSGGSIEESSDGGCRKSSHVLSNQFESIFVSLREAERYGSQIAQIIQLREETSCGLNRILCGRVATGQHRAAQVSYAIKAVLNTANKDFAAPNAAIVAIARTVEADSDNAGVPCAALGENRSNVGAMMLDCHRLETAECESMRCGGILGMGIVRHEQVSRVYVIHRNQILNGFLKCAQRLVVGQVSDVLANECLTVDHERDCILKIGAYCQDWVVTWNCRHGAGSIASGAAKNDRTERSDAGDRVVHSTRDGPLSDQKCVGDSREAVECILVFVRNRFVRAICARHHQRFRRARCEEKMMQRRVGQHYAEFAVSWSGADEFNLRRGEHNRPRSGHHQFFGLR